MHDCPNCGQACDCDGEDTWMEDEHGMPLEPCTHDCDPADLDPCEDYDDDEDD